MIAFLDAKALIYLVEGAEPFAAGVRGTLQRLSEIDGGLAIAVSDLSRLECRVGPLKAGDRTTLSRYDAFFALPDLLRIALTTDVIDLATVLRARHGLKTPDALQAACCLQLGPQHRFVTGGKAFARIPCLHVHRLP